MPPPITIGRCNGGEGTKPALNGVSPDAMMRARDSGSTEVVSESQRGCRSITALLLLFNDTEWVRFMNDITLSSVKI